MKVRRCAHETLVRCSRERCRDPDPYDLEPFETDDELENNCLAYQKPGENDTCMRPENIARSWSRTGRARDPTTGVYESQKLQADGRPELRYDGSPVYEEVWRGGLLS